jgi:hypothetical protein
LSDNRFYNIAMDERTVAVSGVNYRQCCGWTQLFRAFRIAVDLRKLILAGMALTVLSAGNLAFTYLPFAPPREAHGWPWGPWETNLTFGGLDHFSLRESERPDWPLTTTHRSLFDPLNVLWEMVRNWDLTVRPLRTVVEPASVLLRADKTWQEAAYAWTRLLWALVVWSLFAGAITRMAAVQFGRDEHVGLGAALRFSGGKFFSYFSAPLLPIAGLGFLWLLCMLGGLIGRIPHVGEIIVGALWILPLIFALGMVLILIDLVAGWPLMLATISAEGSDAFDGFSRSYSYLRDRPWYFVWLVLVAMAYGSVVIFFVSLVTLLMVYLAGWGVAAGMGLEKTSALFQSAPPVVGGPDLLSAEAGGVLAAAQALTEIWLNVVSVLLIGFVYSYFWTVTTIIYFLLRQSDDATPLDEVYLTDEAEHDDLLPLVGVARSDQPVIERPAAPPPPSLPRRPSGELETNPQAEIYKGDTEFDIQPAPPPEGPQDSPNS